MRNESDCVPIWELSCCERLACPSSIGASPIALRRRHDTWRDGNVRPTGATRWGGRMRRAILKLGDKTTSDGVVLEGIDSCRHHGTPMTFIGAKIWCPACNSEGVIGWKGPHRKATMMGKQQALEGDICLCNCDPPPVLLASQNSAWHVFDAHELGEATGAGQSMAGSDPGRYDEQFRLVDDTGLPRVSVRYRVLIGSNIVASGVTDSAGRTSRIVTDASQQLRLDIAH